MNFWPTLGDWDSVIIGPPSVLSLQPGLLTTFASGVWPAANRALYVPFRVPRALAIANAWILNGATNGNNFDIGIYTMGGVKLGSTGSTAQGTINTVQTTALAVTLGPGTYYMALAFNGTTSTVFRATPVARILAALGVLQQATAFALPATSTPVSPTSAYLPLFGVSGRSVI